MTRGEQPTVFSLKSRRSLPARPAVGGEYGAMACTLGRGLMAPLGNLMMVFGFPSATRTSTDRACASSPSARASVVMAGARRRNAFSDNSCTEMTFT